MSIYKTLPLLEVPTKDWEKRATELLKDEYVRKKCDRKRRLNEKHEYVKKYCKKVILDGRYGAVLDLGPGPGEFLEVCRHYGNFVLGIDAAFDSFIGMGRTYLEYSKLMTERQKLTVSYEGLENLLLRGKLNFPDRFFSLINSQGSMSYIFRNYLLKDKNKFNASLKLNEQGPGVFKWEKSPELENIIELFLGEMSRITKQNGILLIYVNKPRTEEELGYYRSLILNKIKDFRFRLILEAENNCLHKLEKM